MAQATSKEWERMRSAIAPGATDDEFSIFLYLCKEYNLDPLKKEIYFLKYGGKSTVLTSRDGYLKLANSDGNFDGLESDVVYQGDSLAKRDDGSLHIEYGEAHLLFDKSKLMGAYCNIFRKDRAKATAVFVSLKDYYKKGAPIWEQYINAMILKVAESMALKRAFAISGLVTREELESKEDLETEVDLGIMSEDASYATDDLRKTLFSLAHRKGLSDELFKELLVKHTGKQSTKELTMAQANQLLTVLEALS